MYVSYWNPLKSDDWLLELYVRETLNNTLLIKAKLFYDQSQSVYLSLTQISGYKSIHVRDVV